MLFNKMICLYNFDVFLFFILKKYCKSMIFAWYNYLFVFKLLILMLQSKPDEARSRPSGLNARAVTPEECRPISSVGGAFKSMVCQILMEPLANPAARNLPSGLKLMDNMGSPVVIIGSGFCFFAARS